MKSTLPECENEGNGKLQLLCAEAVEQRKILWKDKENRVSISTAGDIPTEKGNAASCVSTNTIAAVHYPR